jgi:hypothetical protein
MTSIRSLVATPPLAEKPVSRPSAPTTRWQGTTIANGLRPRAWPTSRASVGSPSRVAISPYDIVRPGGIVRATS